MNSSETASRVRIVSLYPDLLGTYGDGGNALVLQRRLEWRGIDSEHLIIDAGDPIPDSADLYLLGGGEDGPQDFTVLLKRVQWSSRFVPGCKFSGIASPMPPEPVNEALGSLTAKRFASTGRAPLANSSLPMPAS